MHQWLCRREVQHPDSDLGSVTTCVLAIISAICARSRHVTCKSAHTMKNLTHNLMALQKLRWNRSKSSPNSEEQALRAQIPESILNTFDRLVARQKRPVSIVRNGVCSECHI